MARLPKSGCYSKDPGFQHFISVTLDVFAFLQDYRFFLDRYDDAKNECSVRFKNTTTGVEVRYEVPNPPTVSLARLSKNGQFTRDQYGLKFLICERCPQFEPDCNSSRSSPEAGFEDLLQSYAAILKGYANDVLDGDFSVFRHLDRHVRTEMRRLRKET